MDRCEEFRIIDDEETIPTRSSKKTLERPVRVGYSLSDNSWPSSKLNRRFALYRFRKHPKSVSTSLLFHSWCRTDRGLTASSAFVINLRWSMCSGQHRAPSGIQIFRVKKTKFRSSEETTIELPLILHRHTQHVLEQTSDFCSNKTFSFLLMRRSSCIHLQGDRFGDRWRCEHRIAGWYSNRAVHRDRSRCIRLKKYQIRNIKRINLCLYRVHITIFHFRFTTFHIIEDAAVFGIFSSPFFIQMTADITHLCWTCEWFHRSNRHEHPKERRS